MNISALISSYNNRSGQLGDDFNTKVSVALAHVVQDYILAMSSSFVLTAGCSALCTFFNSMLEKVFHLWGPALLQIVRLNKPAPRVPGPRNFNLMLVDCFEVFAAMDIASYTVQNNHNEHYFIFLQIYDALQFSHMKLIFNYCWTHQLINCDVLLQNALGEITVYTYFPFTSEKCGSVEPVLINHFNGSSFEFPEIFPRKLLNFHGCPLKAALWHIPPYLFLKTDDKGISTVTGGFEGHLLLLLARKLNYSIDVIIPPNDEQRGRYVNGEWNGALGMLHKRTADLSLGCFRKTPVRDINATSISNHYLSTQIICLPKAAYIFTPSEVLFYPFTTDTWFSIIIIFIFSYILLNIFKKFQSCQLRSRNSFLNMLLVSVGMPYYERGDWLYSRLFWTTWLFFTLIMRAMYQSLLFHMIRTRTTYRIPEDIMELVAENYTIVVDSGTSDTLDYSPFLDLSRRVINTVYNMIPFETILKEPSRKIAAIGPRDFLLYFIHLAKKEGEFAEIEHKIVNLPFTIYFTKHSYLINEFHEHVMWIRSGGLLNIWASRLLPVYKEDTPRIDDDGRRGFKELYISIMIGTCGLALATCVFILELLSNRYACLKRIFSQI